jgi:hypothetical protein
VKKPPSISGCNGRRLSELQAVSSPCLLVEIQLQSFLLAQKGDVKLASSFGRIVFGELATGTHWIGDWVSPQLV